MASDPKRDASGTRTWRPRRVRSVPLLLVAIAAVGVLVGAASFEVTRSTETESGVRTTTEFLTHFQQYGAATTTTPRVVPAVLSAVVTAPTRLPARSANYMVNAGVSGHDAGEWVFHETTGIALNTEIELRFQVSYEVGTVAHTFTATEYLETQAAALTGTLTFDLFWDSGAATGITVLSQLELSQVCNAVGTCP